MKTDNLSSPGREIYGLPDSNGHKKYIRPGLNRMFAAKASPLMEKQKGKAFGQTPHSYSPLNTASNIG